MAKKDDDEQGSSIPESVEGAPGSPTESTSSDIVTEASTYDHDRSENIPVKKTGRSLPHVRKTGEEFGENPNPSYGETMEETETKVHRTSDNVKFARKKNVTEIPFPEGRSDARGTPIDSPLAREKKQESFAQKVAEAPRRAAEKLEEIGYSAAKKYDKMRGEPARNAAKETYDSRMAENDIKFHKGEISSAIYNRRKMEYASAFEQEKKPLEKRMVDTSMHVGNAMLAGLQHTQQKVAAEYKASPAPKIKPSQGLLWSKAGKIGITPMRTATRKGKQVGAAAPQRINFGNTGASSGGGIDFSGGLFGSSEPKPERKKKKGR